MNNTKLNGIRLMAGLLASCGFIGSASSDPYAIPEITKVMEQADGTLIAYRLDRAAATPVRYAHEAKLVVSDCVSLGMHRSAPNDTVPALSNRCSYPIVLSYCFDTARTGDGACDAIGHRKMESHRIEPGASLLLSKSAAGASDEVYWVACNGADADVVSSLTRNGTYGECLGKEPGMQPAQVASQ